MDVQLGRRGFKRSELVEVGEESLQQFAVVLAVIIDQGPDPLVHEVLQVFAGGAGQQTPDAEIFETDNRPTCGEAREPERELGIRKRLAQVLEPTTASHADADLVTALGAEGVRKLGPVQLLSDDQKQAAGANGREAFDAKTRRSPVGRCPADHPLWARTA